VDAKDGADAFRAFDGKLGNYVRKADQRRQSISFRRKLSSAGFYDKWKSAFGNEAWALLESTSGKLA
jgi:hypothetical protein